MATANRRDWYVVAARYHRDKALRPQIDAHDRRATRDWRELALGIPPHQLVGIWLVESTTKAEAVALLVCHLAGDAPVGVTALQVKHPEGAPA